MCRGIGLCLALAAATLCARPAPAYELGDLNCDEVINAFDIDPFVLALTDPASYPYVYPDCDPLLADINQDGKLDAFDIDPFVAILVGGGQKPIDTELAGNALAQFPFFEYATAFNENKPVLAALDPTRFPAIVGKTADLYVVAHKSAAQWKMDPSLVDVTPGGPLTVTFSGGTIQANTFTLAGPYELDADAGTGLGIGYDVVADMDRDGELDGNDYVDGRGDEAGLYAVADPVAPGPLAVTEVLYSGGGWLGQDTYYPTSIGSLGKLPLIMISHGNGHNYQWYDHIGTHMASYGYVVCSHQNNTGPGIETCSTTTLTNTDYIIGAQATIAGGVLNGHLDAHHITWIGHSRGAEGITRAYDRIYDKTYTPINYGLADIVLLSSMLPTDFLGTASSNPHGVNYHLWTASGDGDVWLDTYHLFERATGFRQATTVHGAGHGEFHSGSGGAWFTGPCPIGKEAVHKIQKGYFVPLVLRYVEGNVPARDFLWRQWETFKPIGAPEGPPCPESGGDDSVCIQHEYRQPESTGSFVIDDYQTQPALNLSSSGGTVTYTVENVWEDLLRDVDWATYWTGTEPMNGFDRAEVTDTTRGCVFDWAGPAWYEYGIIAAARDFTPFDRLSLRACQQTQHPYTITELGDQTFTVTLRDGAGHTSSINIGAYGGGLEEPYQRSGGWWNEFEVFRIRLTDFLHNGSALDLSDIVAVRLEFGGAAGSQPGRIGLDAVELVHD